MSFLITQPETLTAVATDLAGIGPTTAATNAAQASPTTGVVPAANEVPALTAHAAAIHEMRVTGLDAANAAVAG
jgi:hypothetical protein